LVMEMTIEGKVISGLGVAKIWVSKIKKIFLDKTGKELFSGTLNIKLENDYIFKPDIIIKSKEYGGDYDVYIKRCEVLNQTAYIVRSGKNLNKNGDYKLNIIEIMSEINFREKYKIKDNQVIKVNI